jgi:hypothetical protein
MNIGISEHEGLIVCDRCDELLARREVIESAALERKSDWVLLFATGVEPFLLPVQDLQKLVREGAKQDWEIAPPYADAYVIHLCRKDGQGYWMLVQARLEYRLQWVCKNCGHETATPGPQAL